MTNIKLNESYAIQDAAHVRISLFSICEYFGVLHLVSMHNFNFFEFHSLNLTSTTWRILAFNSTKLNQNFVVKMFSIEIGNKFNQPINNVYAVDGEFLSSPINLYYRIWFSWTIWNMHRPNNTEMLFDFLSIRTMKSKIDICKTPNISHNTDGLNKAIMHINVLNGTFVCMKCAVLCSKAAKYIRILLAYMESKRYHNIM